MLASIGPHMNKYLWWKKYITILQLIQFVLVAIHTGQLFFNGCNFPLPLAALLQVNTLLFIYMFGMFYLENYKKDKKKEKIIVAADKTEWASVVDVIRFSLTDFITKEQIPLLLGIQFSSV